MKQKAITREEVRLNKQGAIATLPKRGCRIRTRKLGRGYVLVTYVAVEKLWRPLLRQLKATLPQPRGNEPLNCVICKKRFFHATPEGHPGYFSADVCSDKCVVERRSMVGRLRRREQANERQMDLSDRTCLHCGEPIQANRNTKRYCSERCRVAAHRSLRSARSAVMQAP
jgi:hypothetical protein